MELSMELFHTKFFKISFKICYNRRSKMVTFSVKNFTNGPLAYEIFIGYQITPKFVSVIFCYVIKHMEFSKYTINYLLTKLLKVLSRNFLFLNIKCM